MSERLGYTFEQKKAPPPPKPSGPHKDRRPKIRGSKWKTNIKVPSSQTGRPH